MAADRWHHLEVTHPRPDTVRVYCYDNFTKPIPSTGVTGRVVTKEVSTPGTAARELAAAPLRSPNGETLEAHLSPGKLPLIVAVKLKFGPASPEERFDVRFEAYSQGRP